MAIARLDRRDIERQLATGEDPEERYPAPIEAAMDGQEFVAADDLERIAAALIEVLPVKFRHLANMDIRYLWKEKGGKSSGKPVLGKCVKAGGLVKFFAESAWVIWLAADHARDFGLSRWQVEATLFHEMLHAGEDVETCEPVTLPHDAEMFAAEVERYGLWKSDLRFVARSFEQLPLWEAEKIGEAAQP